MNRPWMIYGANGYTGKLVAQQAVARGHKPVLAGRNMEAVRAVATELGLNWRAFDLSEANPHLADISVVLHCAGPFSATAEPMVEACLEAECHYLDITGEISVLEWVLAQKERAERAEVALMPGAGFDVVPSDCLARYLSDRLPGADELELAFTGSSSISPGTMKTMVQNLPSGGAIRRDGKIVSVPVAYRSKSVPFGSRTKTVTTIPWGDVATAYHTTRIPNILTYTVVPSAMRWARFLTPIVALPPVQRLIHKWIEANVHGPDEALRTQGRMYLWGRASKKSGESVEANLEVAEGYHFTALSAVAVAEAMEAGRVKPGAWTPGGALGADFVLSIPGSVRTDR
jgi:short subunit dehydrogenase-like uncharacterized protein